MDAYIDTMNANRQYVIDINAFFTMLSMTSSWQP